MTHFAPAAPVNPVLAFPTLAALTDGPLPLILIIFAIFYFLVIRPSGKERRERADSVKNIKKHDKVVTNAGIHGVVVNSDEDTVTLRVDDKANVRIRFSRAAIWQVGESAKKGTAKGSASEKNAGDEPTS